MKWQLLRQGGCGMWVWHVGVANMSCDLPCSGPPSSSDSLLLSLEVITSQFLQLPQQPSSLLPVRPTALLPPSLSLLPTLPPSLPPSLSPSLPLSLPSLPLHDVAMSLPIFASTVNVMCVFADAAILEKSDRETQAPRTPSQVLHALTKMSITPHLFMLHP